MAEIKIEKSAGIVRIHINKADKDKDTLTVGGKPVALEAVAKAQEI
jgi:hypothetical protein